MSVIGLKITNNQGKDICYGAEAIPCCLAAFEADVVFGDFLKYVNNNELPRTTKLNLAYATDVNVFIRAVSGTGCPIINVVNSGGKLAVSYGVFSDDRGMHGRVSGRFRFYVVGRIPNNTPVTGHGCAIWGTDGQLSFYSNFPPSPLIGVNDMGAGNYPNIGAKKAIIPCKSVSFAKGQINYGAYLYEHCGTYVDNSGKVNYAVAHFMVAPFPPTGNWGQHQPYVLPYIDTTNADKKYFND